MIKLFTEKEFLNAKTYDKLLVKCYQCDKSFLKDKKTIKLVLENHINKNDDYSIRAKFCSRICQSNYRSSNNTFIVKCKQCEIDIKRTKSDLKKNKNSFCSKSCSTTFNNKHKSHGSSRSKMEKFLEERLSKLFPELKFNDKTAINSELDIFHPLLKIAFEINGIFHYKPIFGDKKFRQTKKNDELKIILCNQNKIDLNIIDISNVLGFTTKQGEKFLSIIIEKINNKSKNICTP